MIPALREAAREELNKRKRQAARRHLIDFTTYTYNRYKVEAAHRLIADSLDRVLRGKVKRLMIFAPPQHGKSELASVRFPAFWLANRPHDPVILCSYAASLAQSKARQARDLLESGEFAELFPEVRTDKASRARDHWSLAAPYRGSMLAAGVGGPITGHGSKLGIIDDPLENWAQAQSETIRSHVWEWYRTTFRTRVWEGGAIILIMTRWHEDDLAGRLLQTQGDQWEVLRLPAMGESQHDRDHRDGKLGLPTGQKDPLGREVGEALCPVRFSREALDELRRDVGSLGWEAQYMGCPTLPEGNRFKRAWFEIVDDIPHQGHRIRYWDKAGTAGGGDYSAGVLMQSWGGLFYVVDVVRGQWSSGEREAVIKQTAAVDAELYGSVQVWIEQEPGSGGKESAENTIRGLAGYMVYADRVTGSKDVRLEPLAAQAEAGNLRLLRGKWNGPFLEEMCAIPSSRYRDQSDAAAGAFNKLALGDRVKLGSAKVQVRQ